MKKKIMLGFTAVLLVLGLLYHKPVVSYKTELPQNYRQSIESQSQGFYSKKLPLLAVYVSVDECIEEKVFYTIHYFPFGSVKMSYNETDGYNIEKELSRI